MSLPAASALAALSYANPFHPEQCELAVAAAERELSFKAWDARAREILAEGLLCRGLENDDPWTLEAAMAGFAERLARQPKDFWAQLYTAEALRRRFPLSKKVPAAFERAADLLEEADVGEARGELAAHIREALGGVASHRAQFLPLLQRRRAEIERKALTPSAAGDLLTLLGQTGTSGVDRALALLDREITQQLDKGLAFLYRAELLRGRDTPASVAALYRSAKEALCDAKARSSQNECQRARWRLEQLQAAEAREGGRP
jgi:hypothetical protein